MYCGYLIEVPGWSTSNGIHNMFFIPRHRIVAGYYGFKLVVRVAICVSHLSYVRPSVFSFLDDNLSECQWIFTQLGMCIDIVEIYFGIC